MFKPNLLAGITAAIALASASVCFAQEATIAPEFEKFVSTKTRAEVIAETREAARLGLIPQNEWHAQHIADQGFKSLKTRAQVRAETAEAIRLGLVYFGEAGPVAASAEQLEQIRLAGLRALQVERHVASK